MAAPDLRTRRPDRGGPPRRDGAPSWPSWSAGHRVTEPAYADLQHRFEALGGYTLDQRVDEALSGLGLRPRTSGRSRPPRCRGGEQTRAALARLVVADPDLLLLDEPTNHLDLDALEWLEEHLRRRHGSLLVASATTGRSSTRP